MSTPQSISSNLHHYHFYNIYVNKINNLIKYLQGYHHLDYSNLHNIWLLYGYFFWSITVKTKLTTAKIDKLEPSDKQYLVWDEKYTGLGVLVSPKGARSFVYQGRVGGKQKRITLGKYPLMSYQDAIEKASEISKQMTAGIDPSRQKAEQLAKNAEFEQNKTKNSITFGQAFIDYFTVKKGDWSENYIKDHINSAKPYMSDKPCKDGCLAYIWHTPLSRLTPDFIEQWIRHENQTRKTRMAIAYRIYRAFVNWANERETYKDIIPTKSATAKIVSSAVAKTGRHKHSLQRSQLPLWFQTVEQIHATHATALICMLLNGSRPNEMLSLKWENVDFDWKTITIIDKVDQWERTIPLTPYTEYLIRQMPRHSDYIFTANKSGSHTELGKTYRTAIANAGLPPLPPKAMRKSFSNLSEWVSVPHGVVKQIMGHRPSATDEKHYKDRPIDLLRHWHIIIEQFILTEAEIDLTIVYPNFHYDELKKHIIGQ